VRSLRNYHFAPSDPVATGWEWNDK